MNLIQERINELRHRYALTLPDRMTTISGMLMQASRVELLRQFHTLAGTAGTFGYNDVATLAREAERTLAGGDPTAAITPDEKQEIAVRLADLDQAVQRHLRRGAA